jgi:hypothetical protein
VEKKKGHDFIDLTFGTRKFIRAFSYRDILTSASLALLLIAIRELIDYYAVDDWISARSNLLIAYFALIVMVFNHIFYKIEHKRSNNFIGRIFHDGIFLICFAIISRFQLFLAGNDFSMSFGNIGSFLFTTMSLILVVTTYELLVALLKRFLKLLKWQIL